MKKGLNRIAVLAVFAAVIVVLQVASTFIRIGGLPITLTLIPIVIAGALYGVGAGTLMGAVFGVTALVMVVTGVDTSGQTLLEMHPFITCFTCVLKGVLAGAGAAGVYRPISKRNTYVAALAAAAVCPIVNTACFYIVLIAFFKSTWATMVSAFVSVNFLVELCFTVLLAPVIVQMIIAMRQESES